MKHDNSMQTIHTVKDHSKIYQIRQNMWEITT
jgi:hypothetical protein